MPFTHFQRATAIFFTAVLFLFPSFLYATSLSLGADYILRGVSVEERDKTLPKNQYYDQRLQGYLVTDLSRDVEATVRVQSITPWGLEGSTTPLATRYPDAHGGFWVQNAFVRLPNIWKGRIILTAGRQPLIWADGLILSDDELGFDAIRGQFNSPWRRLPFDVDAFTAKISEGLQTVKDTDLTGAKLGFDYNYVRWDIMGLWETSDIPQNYELGADTFSVVTTKLERRIIGVMAKANLKDAYMKGAYFVQGGSVRRENAGYKDVTLGGNAYMIGLGGKSNTRKIGRFGALLELAVGTGDSVNTPEKDEAFRPSFASRWSGLERSGYGNYFAATFSDAYSPANPFGVVDSTNDGLPAGTSGIQSIRFGVESTPWAPWTFTFDYFQYKAQKNLSGPKELGTEFDYGIEYRYSGLVTAKATHSMFNPGEAFDELTRQKATYSTIEIQVRY